MLENTGSDDTEEYGTPYESKLGSMIEAAPLVNVQDLFP